MITDQLNTFECAIPDANLDKRLKQVEQTLANNVNLTSSKKMIADTMENNTFNGKNVNAAKVDATEVDGDQINAKSMNVENYAHIKTLEVDKLINDGETTIEYDEATIKDLTATKATVDDETVNTLKVSKSITLPKMETLEADTVDAGKYKINEKEIISWAQKLEIGNSIKYVDIISAGRPTITIDGVAKEVALKEDIASPLTYKGTVSTEGELPATSSNGDVYFISTTLSIAISNGTVFTVSPLNTLLSAYRTANDQDAIDDLIRTSITELGTTADEMKIDIASNKTEINAVKDDYTTFKDTTYPADKEETATTISGISEKVSAAETEIETLKTGKVDEAPLDGQFYGREMGEWKTFDAAGKYLAKTFEDEDTNTSITNTDAGLVVNSNKDMKVPTSASEAYTASNKASVLNREYLHNNVSISKENTADTVYRYYSTVKTGGYGIGTANSSRLDTTTDDCIEYRTKDFIIKTADYVITVNREITNTGNTEFSASTALPSTVCVIDKNGRWYQMNENVCSTLTDPVDRCSNFIFGVLHPEYVKAHPEYKNVWYVYNNTKKMIGVYDGLKFLGNLDTSITQAQLTATCAWDINASFCFFKDSARGVFVISGEVVCSGAQNAIFIGLNAEGDEGLTECKELTLPYIPYNNNIAAGKDNIWIAGGFSIASTTTLANTVIAVHTNGNVSSYNIQNSTDTVNSYKTALNCFLEMDSGNVIFPIGAYTSSSTATGVFGFIYCDDTLSGDMVCKWLPGNDAGVALTNTTISNTFNNGVPYFGKTSLFETDDKIVAIPQSNFWPDQYGQTSGYTSLISLPVAVQNKYYTINKSTLEVSNSSTPWVATASNYVLPNVVHTLGTDEKRYTWIFPSLLATSSILVISEDGLVNIVDTGNATLTWNGTNTSFTRQQYVPKFTVNQDGIGAALSNDGTTLMLFRGTELQLHTRLAPVAPAAANGYGENLWETNIWTAASALIFPYGSDIVLGNYYGDIILRIDELNEPEKTGCQQIYKGNCAVAYTQAGFISKHLIYDYKYQSMYAPGVITNGNKTDNGHSFIARENILDDGDTVYLMDNGEVFSHS